MNNFYLFFFICTTYYMSDLRMSLNFPPVVPHEAKYILPQSDLKQEAFTVLRNKCNSCHATKKRTDIFTLENMDSLSTEINKQVFVKKKMPKGRKVKLTENESQTLRNWLDTVLEDSK